MSELVNGYNMLTEINGIHADMLQDIGVYVFTRSEEMVFSEASKESAFLLLSGEIVLAWGDESRTVKRESLFDEKPVCLHVPKNFNVKITAICPSEVLIQKTLNDNDFKPVFYDRGDVEDKYLCEGLMQSTAVRLLRDIFNYDNAPYSNMVMGEVITFPGKWSSYPPHHHPQPEVYFYRFDKPQGFGISVIGESAARVANNKISVIPGGLVHPQVAAPGYAMYYCWMIRHLENNPWTARIDEEEHKWLYERNADIWEAKK